MCLMLTGNVNNIANCKMLCKNKEAAIPRDLIKVGNISDWRTLVTGPKPMALPITIIHREMKKKVNDVELVFFPGYRKETM